MVHLKAPPYLFPGPLMGEKKVLRSTTGLTSIKSHSVKIGLTVLLLKKVTSKDKNILQLWGISRPTSSSFGQVQEKLNPGWTHRSSSNCKILFALATSFDGIYSYFTLKSSSSNLALSWATFSILQTRFLPYRVKASPTKWREKENKMVEINTLYDLRGDEFRHTPIRSEWYDAKNL